MSRARQAKRRSPDSRAPFLRRRRGERRCDHCGAWGAVRLAAVQLAVCGGLQLLCVGCRRGLDAVAVL